MFRFTDSATGVQTMTAAIGNEIFRQLGGNRFCAMTGARHITTLPDGLQFGLPRGFAKNGINKVVIKLTSRDDYTVTFYKIVGTQVGIIAEREMVYVDNMREIFTAYTGLACSL
jgi:hypothetical protein